MLKSSYTVPGGYKAVLGVRETERAIKETKDCFEAELAKNLKLERISAPLYVFRSTGLNDNLSGVERPVSFDIKAIPGCEAEIVQSLAKWKRLALHRYNFEAGTGLYTDMNAIRRDEVLDNLHSVYVDQWDWELVITAEDRNTAKLKELVRKIMKALKATESFICGRHKELKPYINEDIFFITSQELEDMYPELTPKQRENEIAKEKKSVFIMQIGGKLKSGTPHDGRAPDYDDWSLNGDILIWYEPLSCAIEISSMGIRVNPETLSYQLNESGCNDRRKLEFHRMLLNGELPLTAGGGIGQSRLCMILLHKVHVGEVQVSLWPQDMLLSLTDSGVFLL